MNPQILKELEKIIKVKFKDTQRPFQALIHRSYLNEHKDPLLSSNERCEFLGDAILELWISDTLFQKFPKFDEGQLTNLRALSVCTQNLSQIANKIKLGEFVALSKGEEAHGGRKNLSILADTFEALIGAIYLDQGIKATFKFLDNNFTENIADISSKKIYKDPKSIFQEIAQAKKGITPTYKTLSESGPDHQKKFEVGVFLEDKLIAKGSGNSKQKAEEDASIKATKLLK